MVSDQCCAMVRDGIMAESADRKHCVVRDPAQGELISDFLVEGKPNKKLLTDFFIVRVNDTVPKKHQKMFIHADFPLILYIAQECDENTAIGIAECVRDRKEIPE